MMEQRVGKALALWGLSGSQTELAAQRENHVYRVTGPDNRGWALRFHRIGYRSDRELASELAWMDALAAGGLAVPEPKLSMNGNLHEEVDGYQTDILSWLDGSPIGRSGGLARLEAREEIFREIGAAMARLHRLSDDWAMPADFERCNWDRDGLLGDNPVWGRFWDNQHLTITQARSIDLAHERAKSHLAGVADGLDYGLIHADLVRENILLSDGGVQFIDFDDGGFGFRLFDVATTLLAVHEEPDFEQLEGALVRGYRSVRPLETELLPLFFLLRAFTYVGWIVPRMGEPGAHERCRRFCERAAKIAGHYLAQSEGHAA